MSTELLRRYRDDVASGRRKADAAQENAVLALDHVAAALIAHKPPSLFTRLLSKKTAPVKGLYCWGGVGRGKTYLMDLFFDTLPFAQKQRLHFHRFMYWLHNELRQRKGEADPVRQVIAELAQTTRVLCFDEFFVSDIGDAMLLAATLDAMFDNGITLVTTSNIPPSDLYRNGLQRDNFLPAIALIQQHCAVLEVDGGVDYRLRELQQHGVFLTPANDHSEQILSDHFRRLCGSEHFSTPLVIHDRAIHTRHWGEGIAWFDFSALCMGPRSQADYIELSKSFHTVLISQIPQLNASLDDAARRFIALVDEFYERHVKLIVSCDVSLDAIYVGEQLAFPYARTRSRLQEMQTESYLRKAHLP